jgi:hypothetical protein
MAKEISVKLNEEKNTLTIVVPLGQGTPSRTGKSLILATTSGFIPTPEDAHIKLSLNVIKN